MKKHSLIYIMWALSMIGVMVHFSCEEEELAEAPQLFRPIPKFDNTMDNMLLVYFKPIEGAVLYHAEISRDTFQTIDQSITFNPDTASVIDPSEGLVSYVVFEDLLAAQDYSIRVKGIHADSSKSSEYYVFYAQTLNLFVSPLSSEIIDAGFKAKWNVRGKAVSRIIIKKVANDSLVQELWVRPSEATSGLRIIEELTGSTEYSIELYSGSTIRGKGLVTTKPVIEGDIVDLSYSTSSTILSDTISAIPSGSVVLLKRGMTYLFPVARDITGSITIMSGYDYTSALATIDLQGNSLGVPDFSSIDEITFKDVNLRSHDLAGWFMFLDNCNIGKVKFENITARSHRGFFRVAEGCKVDSLIINNCVIDSLREYGITHMAADGNIQDIYIKNTTFNWVVRPNFSSSSSVNETNTLTYENVTFYNTPDVGRIFIDYTTLNGVGKSNVSFKNCIFGKVQPLVGTGADPSGVRVGFESYSMQGSYATNDFSTASSEYEDRIPLEGIIPYSQSSYDLFTDPDKGEFKIKDSGFSGANSAGDPRWW